MLVGGTGRSGTSILGRLIGHHSAFAFVPMEIRFHTETGGLADLLEGAVSRGRFERRMRGKWFYREREDGRPRGLHKIVDEPTLDAALRRFADEYRTDQRVAAGRLVRAILDPFAEEAGKAAWVETTPAALARAGTLATVLPDARWVNIVRDGRDVACSVARRPWGPATPEEGLGWWADRLRAADTGAQTVPDAQLHVVRFEDLLVRHRDAEYARLLRFLGVDDEPALRRYFDDEMPPDRARVGRWRRDVPSSEQADFDRAYRTLLEKLAGEGLRDLPDADVEDGRP